MVGFNPMINGGYSTTSQAPGQPSTPRQALSPVANFRIDQLSINKPVRFGKDDHHDHHDHDHDHDHDHKHEKPLKDYNPIVRPFVYVYRLLKGIVTTFASDMKLLLDTVNGKMHMHEHRVEEHDDDEKKKDKHDGHHH